MVKLYQKAGNYASLYYYLFKIDTDSVAVRLYQIGISVNILYYTTMLLIIVCF